MLSGKRPADVPFSSFQVQLPLAVDLEHPGAFRIGPASWVWVVAAWTGLPAAGGDLHGQSLVGTDVVVLPAIAVEPELWLRGQRSAPVERALERTVEAFDLALRLRMADTAPVELDALAHEPERQVGSRASLGTPPWGAVVHQHGLGQAATLEGFHELLLDRTGERAAVGGQRDQVPAMVVEHRQGSDRLWPGAGPLEVHLPEFVGRTALEALRGRAVAVPVSHQLVTQQDAVDGAACQRDTVAIEQDLELARTPVGIPQTHLDHLLFALDGRLSGTVMGPAAVLGDAFHPAGAIAFQPAVSRRNAATTKRTRCS